MEMYVLLIFPVVLSIFAVLLMQRNQRLDIEAQEKLIHKFNCGGRFRNGQGRGMRLSGPFVQVRMYDDFMIISYFRKIKINYKDITEIKRGLFGHKIVTTDYMPPKCIELVCRPEDIAVVESKIL